MSAAQMDRSADAVLIKSALADHRGIWITIEQFRLNDGEYIDDGLMVWAYRGDNLAGGFGYATVEDACADAIIEADSITKQPHPFTASILECAN